MAEQLLNIIIKAHNDNNETFHAFVGTLANKAAKVWCFLGENPSNTDKHSQIQVRTFDVVQAQHLIDSASDSVH